VEPTDLTLEVLKGIRSELVSLRQDVNDRFERMEHQQTQTNDRLGKLEERQAETNERLEQLAKRQTETEVRLATEIVEVAKAIGGVKDLLKTSLDVRSQVDDHERRLSEIEARLQQ
jgi:hypothetical protein